MNLWSMVSVAVPYIPTAVAAVILLLSRQTVVIAIFGLVAIAFAADRAARAETARHVVDRLTGRKFDENAGPPPSADGKHERGTSE
ncbi:hypothetical protein NYQ31_02795 [Curtobacterium flaccumfaciens]|uniref:hypothetical protein n=1 Tax=Curtobacterium flaccumfaciens TaxID=2035 RepID=UPI00217E08BE|nr:hypothetical protein [Curtobacterium flaccumfaciens]MCS6557321.1 hypothetical protein [Curtobacterium flaccumfaciens]